MARIKGKHTKPELIVRRAAYGLGCRYRLHQKDLPGTPDLVFKGRKKAVFVHGCFWHRHDGCPLAAMPKTRSEFWNQKFEQNVARDRRDLAALQREGWQVLLIWECETRDPKKVIDKLTEFLG